ncbi:MAG: hypothetical protein FWC64_01265 [Treponema sp.]|nr:hypothetical protein [Treponema sp.]
MEQTLTANTSELGGSGTISFQWQRQPAAGGTWANIGTGSTYTLQADDLGFTIRVVVSRATILALWQASLWLL